MSRSRAVLAAGLAVALALAPGLAFARAGGGSSFGSRGGFTFSAPPSTSTAPSGAFGMQRSMTARPEMSPGLGGSSYGTRGYGAPGYGSAFGGRSAFTSGLMGGLLGAGIGGMLFGHGMFGGMDGGMSFLGLLLQIGLLFLLGRWLYRTFARGQPMFAGMAGGMRAAPGGGSGMPPVPPAGSRHSWPADC